MNDTEDAPRECFSCGTSFTGMGVMLFISLRDSPRDYDMLGRTTTVTNDVLCIECGGNGGNYWTQDRYDARAAERETSPQEDSALAALRREMGPGEPEAPDFRRLVHHSVDDTYTVADVDGFTLRTQGNGRLRMSVRDRSVNPATAALIARALRADRTQEP